MEAATNKVAPNNLSPERMAFIDGLIAVGGPEPHEYAAFTAWIETLAEDAQESRVGHGLSWSVSAPRQTPRIRTIIEML